MLNERAPATDFIRNRSRDELVNKYSTADSLNTDKELAEVIANHLSEAEDSALTIFLAAIKYGQVLELMESLKNYCVFPWSENDKKS